MSIFTVIAIVFFVIGSLIGLNGMFNPQERVLYFDSAFQEFVAGIILIIMAGVFRFIGKSRKPDYLKH